MQTYTYERDQLKTVQLPNGQSMTWDGYQWQRPGQITMPGSVQTLSYDALQRTKGINVKANNATVMNRAYTYDKAGNIIERQTEEGTYSYGYDLLDRVTQVNPPQSLQTTSPPTLPVEAFAYDAVHNRIGSAQQPGDWQYNANNQLMQFGEGAEQTVYTYIANGHVATQTTPAAQGGETKTYTYDATDRLVSVHSGNAEVARYAYDPFGRRISKTVGGVTTHYLYTDEGLIAELDSAGNIQVAYGWQADTMFGTTPLWQAQVSSNNLQTAGYHFIITDHLGTPQMAVNPSGETTWKATSEVFGKTTPDAANQITMNLRFPGQYYDEETNTHYNYFRDYNPAVGRYVQRDPIGLWGGINTYGYVSSNPLKHFDPLGLKKYAFNNLDCEELARDIERQLVIVGNIIKAIEMIKAGPSVPDHQGILDQLKMEVNANPGGYRSENFSTRSEAYQYAVNQMEGNTPFTVYGVVRNIAGGYYHAMTYGVFEDVGFWKYNGIRSYETEMIRALYLLGSLKDIYEKECSKVCN